MGNLPWLRVTPGKPFERSGIDFAGSVNLRPNRGRGGVTRKAYLAIVICMATKAIHSDLVSDLSSEMLILCLQRFIARRGGCSVMYNDNGRNFLGCSKLIAGVRSEISRTLEDQKTKEFLLSSLIKWKFIPPYSPHIGGIWESGVRSVKYHLNRVFGDQVLTVEEMNTALAQIEAILNARPINSLSEDVENMEVITPSHLIKGYAAVGGDILPCNDSSKIIAGLKRYENLKARVNSFWKGWRRHHFDALLKRSKWIKKGAGPKEGDLVLIKRKFEPPSHWSLGRILKIFPGDDKVVRIVDVRSNGKVSKESVRN